jgi:hypothetical protein
LSWCQYYHDIAAAARAAVSDRCTRHGLLSRGSTYHWNETQGQPGGQIILLRADGSEVGRWKAMTSSGQGNAADVNWFCRPNVKIPAGTYEVTDSSRSTWSYNSQSRGQGFSEIKGYPEL